ncbi:T9SS type A sorting domain-containing protein [Paraflavisolibacter sp. H34]|uniref:T9SS type A sorting domain-containing protein n=1 Tax=Huijunlia imazamoxiresistens TaxID=3127457 RepID=UPI003018B163
MKSLLFLILCLLGRTLPTTAQAALIPMGSSWKYYDKGKDPGSSWQKPSAKDGSWRNGAAPMGYGFNGLATTVSFGSNPQQKYITTYFRKKFSLSDPLAYESFSGSVSFRDGIVVYVNGKEVFRKNLPGGGIGYKTYASYSAGVNRHSFTIDKNVFTSGPNLVAVELHRSAAASSLYFDLGLTGNLDRTRPRVLSSMRQSPAAFFTSSPVVTFRVNFSEEVKGVEPSDFTLDGAQGNALRPSVTVKPAGTAGTAYDVTVGSITNWMRLRLDIKGGSVYDHAGNTLSGGYTFGQTYIIDPQPTVLAINRLLPAEEDTEVGEVTYRVHFSQRVNGVDAADFNLAELKGDLSGAISSVRPAGSGGNLYDVTVSGLTREVRLRLDLKGSGTGITDVYGKSLYSGFTSGQVYSLNPAPRLLRISRQAPLEAYTADGEVTFRVVFSEKVKGVDASHFYTTPLSGDVRGTLAVLANEPLGKAPRPVVTPVGSDGTTYDVTVHGITGNGTLRLDAREGRNGIKDADGQSFSAGFSSGEAYSFRQNTSQRLFSVTDLAPVAISKNTADKPQAKVWYHAGRWWSVLSTPGGTKLFRLDGASWSEVLTLHSSGNLHADCRVVGDVTHILLFQPESDSHLVSVAYDSGMGSYRLWGARPKPAELRFGTGAESATLAVDGRGRMWVASAAKTDVNVRWSDPPYSQWSDTFRIVQGILDDDICAITPLPGKIGVLWSNQSTQRFGFKTHTDGDDPRSWSADEEPASAHAQRQGNGFGDDHLNVLCASDGTLYCAVKTSYDTPGYPKISLLVRNPWGGWSFYPVSSIEGTRGIAVLNERAGRLKIIYGSKEEGGDIIYRETALPQIEFGPPRTLISGKYLFNEATSTHQSTGGEVVVLATNQDVEPKLAVGVLARDAEDARAAPGDAGTPAAPAAGVPHKPEPSWPGAYSIAPNPATGTATISFTLLNGEAYCLVLYDFWGNRVAELEKGQAEGGRTYTHSIDAGRLAAGMYLLRLQTPTGSRTLQWAVMK